MFAPKFLKQLAFTALIIVGVGAYDLHASPFYREIFVRCGVPGIDPLASASVAWSALAGGRTIGNPHNLRVNTPGSPNVFTAINSFPMGTTPGSAFFPEDPPDVATDLLIYTQEISFDIGALTFVRYDQRLSGSHGSENNGTRLAFLIGETWYISDQIFSQIQISAWETVAVDPRNLTYGTTPFAVTVGPFRPTNSGLPLPASGAVAGFGVFMNSVDGRVRLDNYELSDDAVNEHDPGPQGTLLQCPVTETPTLTPTVTPTDVPSVTVTPTPSATPTATTGSTPSPSPTVTATSGSIVNPTSTPTENPTNTPSVIPSATPSPTPTRTPSSTATATPLSVSPTVIPTATATSTGVPTFNTQACSTVANVTNKGKVDEGAVRLAALTAKAAAFLQKNARFNPGPALDAMRAARKAQVYVEYVQTLLIEYPEVSKVCPDAPLFCASVDRSPVLGELNSLYRKLLNSAKRFTARAFFDRSRSTKKTKRNRNLRLVKQAYRSGLTGLLKLPKVETVCK